MTITIFTPTYNRAKLLPRLYQSLLQQTIHDFEWLIIDDGSSDETEKIVAAMMAENRILIRYYYQENGGKHTAHNSAVKLAQCAWLICVDSDDVLEKTAVETVLENLNQLYDTDCGIIAHKRLQNGEILGKAFSPDMAHMGMYQLSLQGYTGEYALVMRVDVLKENLYPVVPKERFLGESVLYDQLEMAGYTLCPVDRVLQICEYQADGLSSAPYRLMVQNPAGYAIYYRQRIDLAASWRERIGYCIRFQAFRWMSRNKAAVYRGPYRVITALLWPVGLIGTWYYRKKACK